MIALFTDFSVSDPYVGLMKMAIYQRAPDCRLIDICHDLPEFNSDAAGRLLQMMVRDLPQQTIILAVVDPGVGTARHPLWLEVDGKHFIGPDNGLFARIVNQGSDIKAHILEYDVDNVSTSFHGRDVFAPAAVQIALGNVPITKSLNPEYLIGRDWPDELFEIIYIDHYGNALTGITSESISEDMILVTNQTKFRFRRTFWEAQKHNEFFWYKNSIGLIELSVNQGSLAGLVNIKLGDEVTINSLKV